MQTIRLFISESDDREMRLASDNSWTRRRLKHLSWISRWIILCTLERRMAVSCEISRGDWCLLACLPDWAWGPPLLHDECGLPLPGCQTISSYIRLADSLQQTVNASKFPTLVRQCTQQPSCTILFWQIEVFNQNCILRWNFHDFV